MIDKIPITESLLRTLYHENKHSQVEISKILNFASPSTVGYYFKKFNIKTREPYQKKKFPTVDHFFDKWTSDMAYVLGFIICDGNISEKGLIRIELNREDIEILEFIRNNICPTQEIKFRNRFDGRTNKTYNSAIFYFTSPQMAKALNNFGVVPNKTGKEICPSDIPEKFIPDFIRGVIDGDGSIIRKNININDITYNAYTLQISCSCGQFLKDMQEKYLFGLGSIVKTKNVHQWNVYNREDINRILSYVYNGNFYLQRKYNKYLDFLKLVEDMKDNKISQGTILGVKRAKLEKTAI